MDEGTHRGIPNDFLRPAAGAIHGDTCHRALTNEHGTALPPFVDKHVHLQLIEAGTLRGIAGVLDLGGDPSVLVRHAAGGFPHITYAGAMLTAPGGYPSDREWALPGLWREVSSASRHPGVPGGAGTAVDEQASFGASVVKVALNATAGPVFDAETLAAIVGAAHERGLPVVAHVEGDGMLTRALGAGVDALAHTPFTERVSDDDITRAVDADQCWITTLAIHDDPALAIDNLARLAAAGGRVLYGTDLGNGERPVGIQEAELAGMDAAGIRGDDLIAALTDPWPLDETPGGVATFIPGPAPATLDEVPAWLARGVVVPNEELVRDDV